MSASVQHKVLIHSVHGSPAASDGLPQLGELLRAGWRVVTVNSATPTNTASAAAADHAAVILLERAEA